MRRDNPPIEESIANVAERFLLPLKWYTADKNAKTGTANNCKGKNVAVKNFSGLIVIAIPCDLHHKRRAKPAKKQTRDRINEKT